MGLLTGLQVRVQPDQGSRDDTALNGIKLACCPFTSAFSHANIALSTSNPACPYSSSNLPKGSWTPSCTGVVLDSPTCTMSASCPMDSTTRKTTTIDLNACPWGELASSSSGYLACGLATYLVSTLTPATGLDGDWCVLQHNSTHWRSLALLPGAVNSGQCEQEMDSHIALLEVATTSKATA